MLVAEIGASHNRSFDTAIQLIDAAAWAGADAVKFQTFNPEQMAIPHTIEHGAWVGYDMVQLYKEAETPRRWHKDLFDHAKSKGLIAFSTPFHPGDVDFLETLDCPIYKIASYELTDLQLIEHAAKTRKPLIMSTGMASEHEIEMAVSTAHEYTEEVTLLHCVSEYPAPIEHTNLETMNYLKQFGCLAGLSDHSRSPIPAVCAITMGATVIEKHIQIGEGLDKGFAISPGEFKTMVLMCKDAQRAMGKVKLGGNTALRRSLYYNKALKAGDVINVEDIKTARPELGLSPLRLQDIIGTTLENGVKENDPVRL